MQAVPVCLCQLNSQLRREQGGDIVPPFCMGGNVGATFDAFKALNHSLFIFGMDRDEAPRSLENSLQGFSVVDQQGTCGGAHEDLDATDAWDAQRRIRCSNGFLEVSDVVGGCADEETVVVHAFL